MNTETWKSVKDFENLYIVSNKGNVKSLIKNINLKQFIRNNYLFVRLYKNNKYKNFNVHRLVAKMFIDNIDNKPCVNHIDGNKLNNCVENLEWCTYSENEKHKYIKLKYKGSFFDKKHKQSSIDKIKKWHNKNKKFGKDNVNSKKIKCIETNVIYDSLSDVGRIFNVNICNLSSHLKGKRKTFLKCTWEYVN